VLLDLIIIQAGNTTNM